MVRWIVVCLSLSIAFASACAHRRPAFLSKVIASYQTQPQLAPREIWYYDLNGDAVYYVSPQCCDIQSILYDEHGNILCHPDGGITGRGDGRCPTFFDDRKKGQRLWTNLNR